MNNIRRFKLDELDELDDIMKIWLETNKQAHHFIDGAYWDSMFDAVKEMLPQSTIYVYEVNEQLQGFIGIIDQDIAGIFITQHNQSQGIGKKLLQYAKEKYDTLTLQVYEKNSRAVQFYKREGFVITKEQLDEETGQLEYVMAWGNEVRSDSNSAV